jgi:hypothetical protein
MHIKSCVFVTLKLGLRIMLLMIAMMPLSVGDELFLHLPQFSGVGVSCEETESTPVASTFGKGRYKRIKSSEKNFPIMKDVPAGESLSIFVPSTSVVKLPSKGINSNTVVYISTNTVLGPINPTRSLTMPTCHTTIGLFSRYLHCALNYGFDPRVNMDVPILFYFSYKVSLFSKDLIVSSLPGFEGKSESLSLISNVRMLDQDRKTDFFGWGSCAFKEYSYPVINHASWNTNDSYALPGPVASLIPRDSALRLPIDGMKQNQIELCMSVDAIAGRVTPHDLVFESVACTSSNDGVPSEISQADFEAVMKRKPAKTKRKRNPLQARRAPSVTVWIHPAALNTVKVSISSNVTLISPATIKISGLPVHCDLCVYESANMKFDSTMSDNQNITIRAENSAQGSDLQTPILRSCGILAIDDMSYISMDFQSRVASQLVVITVEMSPIMTLFPGDKFQFLLPGFSGDFFGSDGEFEDPWYRPGDCSFFFLIRSNWRQEYSVELFTCNCSIEVQNS